MKPLTQSERKAKIAFHQDQLRRHRAALDRLFKGEPSAPNSRPDTVALMDRCRELHAEGRSLEDIAASIGRGVSRTRELLYRAGCELPDRRAGNGQGRRRPDEITRRVVESYRQTRSIRKTGAEFGYSGEGVRRILKEQGVDLRISHSFWERVPEPERERIREARRNGASAKQLEAEFGFNQSALYQALSREGVERGRSPDADPALRFERCRRRAAERIRLLVANGAGDACAPYSYIQSGNLLGMNGRTCTVQRFAYEILVGAVPEGLWVTSTCKNRRCVNPAHLKTIEPGGWARKAASNGKDAP